MNASFATAICMAVLMLVASSASAEIERAHAGISYSGVSYEATNVIQAHSVDDSEGGHRVFGGYRFGDHALIEGSWTGTTGFDASFMGNVGGLGETRLAFNADYEALTARVLGVLPTDRVNLFGGIGVYRSSLDAHTSWSIFTNSPIPVESVKTSRSGATMVVGIEFKLSDSPGFAPGVRLDYEWFESRSGIDISALNIGIVFRSF